MPITSLEYTPPIRRADRAVKPDYEGFDEALALAEQGQARAALQRVFSHLFPGADVPDLGLAPFTITQGSSRVTTRVEGDDVAISVALVTLPSGGSAVAALRYVLTRLSAPGQLYQPRLRGDDVYLEFRDSLARLHPAKVLEVLRRMPIEADACDDWLIGQFGARPLDRAVIEDLSDDELERAVAVWRTHWGDVEELIKESQRRRSLFFLNELTAYAIYHVRFALPLCGFVSARIAEAASTFNDADVDPARRETVLAKCAREMKALSREELRDSLGHATYAISPRTEGTAKILADYYGPVDYMSTIDNLRKTSRSIEAALALIGSYTFLLAVHAWPAEVEAELKNGLAEASGKPWRESAALLFSHARHVVDRYGEERNDEGGAS